MIYCLCIQLQVYFHNVFTQKYIQSVTTWRLSEHNPTSFRMTYIRLNSRPRLTVTAEYACGNTFSWVRILALS